MSDRLEIGVAQLRAILRRTLAPRVVDQVVRELRGERLDLEAAARRAEALAGEAPLDEVTRAAVRRARRRHG